MTDRQPVTAWEAAIAILRRLREAGHVAYLAGGCVRDALLGLEPTDYDVATDATPDVVRRLFRRSRYVGEAFGVVLVRLGRQEVEVATFRTESGYHDGRHPDHVAFSDARHDASRRDFTINGLFADPLEGRGTDGDKPSAIREEGGAFALAHGHPLIASSRVIDYVDGLPDLRAGVVRAIGDADARFAEDYLRMLRAARFAARLGFEVEAATAAAVRRRAKDLGRISRERIGMEVVAMMRPPVTPARVGEARARAVELMQALGLDGVVLKEERRDRPTATLRALAADAGLGAAMAAWVLDRYADPASPGDVERFVAADGAGRVERWRAALCLSNGERDDVRGVLSLVARALGWGLLGVAGRKRLLAEPRWGEARKVLDALPGEAAAGRVAALEAEAAPLVAEGVAPAPLIDGSDLIAAGLRPGPAFGRWLEGVYDAQLEGRVTTREEALAWVAAESRGE